MHIETQVVYCATDCVSVNKDYQKTNESSIFSEIQFFYHFRWRCSSSRPRIDRTEVQPRDRGTGTDLWRHTGPLRH